ncbi:MAG: hypothetical protein LBP50_07765 [Tannerella sp.]|jgi:hypothetical protein|nr:hypothetical protein [Tannerella sp.]
MDKFCRLTEKYFEGLTSLKEEQQLRSYYRRKKIAPELELYKPVFDYFNEERGVLEREVWISRKSRVMKLFFPVTAVAACALLIFALKRHDLRQSPGKDVKSLAYIHTQKITDIEIIGNETLNSLENLAEETANVYTLQIEALNLFTDMELNR